MTLIHNTSLGALLGILYKERLVRDTLDMSHGDDFEDIELPISVTRNNKMKTDQDEGCISGEVKIHFSKDLLKLPHKVISYRAKSYFTETGHITEEKLTLLKSILREYNYIAFETVYNNTFNKKENTEYLINKLQVHLNGFKDEEEVAIYSEIPISLISRVTLLTNDLAENEVLQLEEVIQDLEKLAIPYTETNYADYMTLLEFVYI